MEQTVQKSSNLLYPILVHQDLIGVEKKKKNYTNYKYVRQDDNEKNKFKKPSGIRERKFNVRI